jgi:hypothetical protein
MERPRKVWRQMKRNRYIRLKNRKEEGEEE